jgi:CMP-N-acetylneuraminic acid synthetase
MALTSFFSALILFILPLAAAPYEIILEHNKQDLTLSFAEDSILHNTALAFVREHGIREAHNVGCYNQACVVAVLIRQMENLLPPRPFTPESLKLLDEFNLDPADVPYSVCEMLSWYGVEQAPVTAAQRTLFCDSHFPSMQPPSLKESTCENLLSDLCQVTLSMKDPDEIVHVVIKIFSEYPNSIMADKQRKHFSGAAVLGAGFKRRDVNDWLDRSFGRVICMIPARAGSERLKLKNMRNLNGKTLIEYAIEKAKAADVCDRIVVNSDSPAFSQIAKRNNVEFYARPKHLGTSTSKADDVVYDFMNTHPGDLLVWVNPTSPLQPVSEIREVVVHLLKTPSIDSLVTVTKHQRHAVMSGVPLNFDPTSKGDKTQDLQPVHIAVYSILAWQYKPFRASYEKNGGSAYFNGKVEYYEVGPLSGFVVKYKEDMEVAESILKQMVGDAGVEEREYDELAETIFDGSDEELFKVARRMDEETAVTVFVLSTYIGDRPHPFVVSNVEKMLEFHPDAIVHVVDNGSKNRDHVAKLSEMSNVVVHQMETTGYELGAFSHVWKQYKDAYGTNSYWVCMQDIIELQRPLPLKALNEQQFMPLSYFTFPLFDLGSDFEGARIQAWVEDTLAGMGMAGQAVRSAVFANSFATTWEGMVALEEVGLFDVVLDEKMKSQGLERLLGGIFANLGCEPYTYALTSMSIMVSKGRADRGVPDDREEEGTATGNVWFKKQYPNDFNYLCF